MHSDSHIIVSPVDNTVSAYCGGIEPGWGYSFDHVPTFADLRWVARRHFGTGSRSLRRSSELQYRLSSVRYDIVLAA